MTHNKHHHQVLAPLTGNIWKITAKVGDTVSEGDTILIMESMKMEIPVEAGRDGKVETLLVQEGQAVSEGQPLAVIHM
ncbi:MAG TPA: biotin/lipoyl-binding carrier protein [Pseudomonadota bacterium]|nr:biotin/lipoyl-binding carrier protein [Pseudomonadota bacterium]